MRVSVQRHMREKKQAGDVAAAVKLLIAGLGEALEDPDRRRTAANSAAVAAPKECPVTSTCRAGRVERGEWRGESGEWRVESGGVRGVRKADDFLVSC